MVDTTDQKQCYSVLSMVSLSCIDSIDIYSNDGMVEKPSVSAFKNFLQIENRLNIKKVMGRNVWMCFVSTLST